MKAFSVVIVLSLLLWAHQSGAIIPFAFWRSPNQLDPAWTPKWSNLKAYWTFNGALGAIGNGATLNEYFGTSNATSTAAGLSYVGSKLMQGVSFNGSTYLTVPQTAPANVCTAMTWVTWVKWNAPASNPSWGGLMTNWNGCSADAGWAIGQANGTKKVEISVNTTAIFNQSIASSAAPLDGTWHHLALTITAAGAAVFYVDGVQDTTVSFSMGAGICSPTAVLRIGGHACGDVIGNGAILDEMAIWNAALSATEISTIYNRQKNGF